MSKLLLKEKKKAIRSILKNGYYVFKSVYTNSQIDNFSRILSKLRAYGQGNFYKNTKVDKSTKIILNLQSKNKAFLQLIENNLMNTINSYFLNDKNYRSLNQKLPNYILSQFVARSSGNEPCVIHMDDTCPSTSKIVNYLQWGVPMKDTNTKNGCSTLKVKSHRFGLENPKSYNKSFKDIKLKKGDLVVWDGRIWHGAKANFTKEDRWVVIVTFSRWFFKPHYDIARAFPKKFYKFLNVKKKIILGFASIPKSSEKMGLFQRGDLKTANKFINKRIF